jgi:hypothetical protein
MKQQAEKMRSHDSKVDIRGADTPTPSRPAAPVDNISAATASSLPTALLLTPLSFRMTPPDKQMDYYGFTPQMKVLRDFS